MRDRAAIQKGYNERKSREYHIREQMRDEGDALTGEWQGPPYEYGVTWGPRPTSRKLIVGVLVTLLLVYALLTAALVLFA